MRRRADDEQIDIHGHAVVDRLEGDITMDAEAIRDGSGDGFGVPVDRFVDHRDPHGGPLSLAGRSGVGDATTGPSCTVDRMPAQGPPSPRPRVGRPEPTHACERRLASGDDASFPKG